jgi:nitronate monooxygenase
LLGHSPDDLPRETVAEEDGRPIYRYSTDSPLRSMTGAMEALAPYAGQVCGLVIEIRPAGDVVRSLVREAEETLVRLHA